MFTTFSTDVTYSIANIEDTMPEVGDYRSIESDSYGIPSILDESYLTNVKNSDKLHKEVHDFVAATL